MQTNLCFFVFETCRGLFFRRRGQQQSCPRPICRRGVAPVMGDSSISKDSLSILSMHNLAIILAMRNKYIPPGRLQAGI